MALRFPRIARVSLLPLGAALALFACPKAEAPAEADAGPEPRPLAGRTGVQVPMPPGWTARIGAENSFQAGPPGTALLRIDRRPDEADALPSPDELRSKLQASLGPGHLAKIREETAEGWSLLYFEVVASPPDAGAPRKAQPAVLGAKAVDDDLYLCASLPGAKPADVEAVARACRELTVRAAP